VVYSFKRRLSGFGETASLEKFGGEKQAALPSSRLKRRL